MSTPAARAAWALKHIHGIYRAERVTAAKIPTSQLRSQEQQFRWSHHRNLLSWTIRARHRAIREELQSRDLELSR